MCNNPQLLESAMGFTLSKVGEAYRITTAGRVIWSGDCELVARMLFATLANAPWVLNTKPSTPCTPENVKST